MLRILRVKNLAIVEDIHVAFRNGLNMMTGETGAGKSIIAGALGLVLGERADRTMIRAGADACSVEAEFHLSDASRVHTVLEERGIQPCEEQKLIIRRIVSASGPGRNVVNDSAATLQALKRIGDLLVDMHGPHDHQSLLSKESQLELLDAFGDLAAPRLAYRRIYDEMANLEKRRAELEGDDRDVAREIDMLSYQVKEIEAADLGATDEEQLEQEHRAVANAGRILELADGVRNALTEADTSAFDTVAFARKSLEELRDLLAGSELWEKQAESIAVQIQELSADINSRVQDVEGDPARLQWLEDRMALLHRLKRKYSASLGEILESLEQTKQRLQGLETRGERIAELDADLARCRGKLTSAAGKLGRGRRQAAERLAARITGELHDLGFPHAAFDVSLDVREPGPSGTDDIEFGFAPNPGEPMRPLRAIASSGEISRVMLAVKAVLASHDSIPVLVFDEIDTNVGGAMGTAIGSKLTTVAENHQVLCITHLPQVAVHGTTHFVVTKDVGGGRTRTHIREVKGGERTREVARMLGGRDLTGVAIKHAEEMLKRPKAG